MALTLLSATAAPAQRLLRVGPQLSSASVENGNGASQSYPGFGGLFAVLTGDDNETGVAVTRYNDLSDNSCTRQLTFIALNSFYYPVGAKGVAPFASTELGLARVSESQAPLIFSCTGSTPVETSSQLGFAFGLGVRVNIPGNVIGAVEGRFVQVPNSFIQGLEARANLSLAFGPMRKSEILEGTLGPAVSLWVPLSGGLEARAPLAGVRFRRNTNKGGVLGLQIDYAALRDTSGCSGCEPTAILFAPSYEPSLYPQWGRVYFGVGPLLAGIPTTGPDRGMAQGIQGGLGADIYGGNLMWNVNGRVLWLQRNGGHNAFAVQIGVSLSTKLERPLRSTPKR